MIILGGALAALLLGTGGLFVLYDRATAPDRSTPDVAVYGFLQAHFVDRNDTLAQQLVCRSPSLAQFHDLRADLVERESRFGTSIDVSWGSMAIEMQGSEARVRLELILSAVVNGSSQSERQSWMIQARNEGGWRICQAERLI
ncbi:hypothetical protein [Plantactinospora sp. GCM10030261]|uniref:hypothetical protein n=1 Tax=Plantactinospora sp. GCM10030261 TaxID=3273420 RepID=UPI003619D310